MRLGDWLPWALFIIGGSAVVYLSLRWLSS